MNMRSVTSMRMARKAGSHAEITGPAIQDAALKLFARSGYAAVSMREIAAEVGVRAGALYLYTPDKQTLLFDLMKDHLQALDAAWTRARGGTTPLERLKVFVEFHVEYHFDLRDAVFISYMELRNLTSDNFAHITGMRSRYEDALAGILREGMAEGVFAAGDEKVAVYAVIAMLTGIGTWFDPAGRLRLDEIQALYWEMVRKAVAP